MPEEMLDYFDENYSLLGTATKSEARSLGLWVHSFHCWMLSKGAVPSLLVQKRASTKQLFPDYLDISAAGHLSAGERVRDGVREIAEEVGLQVAYEDLIPLGVKLDVAKTGDITNRQFCNVFLYPDAPTIGDLKLDLVELDGMVSIPVEAGLQLFSGEIASLTAPGVEKVDGGWKEIEKLVTADDFIPRVDPYYYKMFVIADLHLKGYKHLAI